MTREDIKEIFSPAPAGAADVPREIFRRPTGYCVFCAGDVYDDRPYCAFCKGAE